MSGVPFIYYIPKKFFFSTFNEAFSFSCKGEWVFMYSRGAEHPYFTVLIYTCHSGSLAVRHFEPNCISYKSSERKIKKWVMTVALIHFSIIILSKIRSYLNSSLHCNWVNVIRHVDSILVSNLPPSSLNEW